MKNILEKELVVFSLFILYDEKFKNDSLFPIPKICLDSMLKQRVFFKNIPYHLALDFNVLTKNQVCETRKLLKAIDIELFNLNDLEYYLSYKQLESLQEDESSRGMILKTPKAEHIDYTKLLLLSSATKINKSILVTDFDIEYPSTTCIKVNPKCQFAMISSKQAQPIGVSSLRNYENSLMYSTPVGAKYLNNKLQPIQKYFFANKDERLKTPLVKYRKLREQERRTLGLDGVQFEYFYRFTNELAFDYKLQSSIDPTIVSNCNALDKTGTWKNISGQKYISMSEAEKAIALKTNGPNHQNETILPFLFSEAQDKNLPIKLSAKLP
ncbi:hypothetical protein L3V82_04265 [Thiotrichales bacterium 19S3-7]|nr:hypothetical protein [Thiotrichales bacterium 19S3-7]MCF6802686.1 hypothetical protein [Thiotrichales bacterium 19S3-11]